MKTICVIGPLPPPINGNSKAVDTIISSKEFNDVFNIETLNLSSGKVGASGKFSISKLVNIKKILKKLKFITRNKKIDYFYLTIAQSTLGAIRDLYIFKHIYKQNPQSKVIIHLHGGGFKKFFSESNFILKILLRKYYRKVYRAIVLSHSLLDMFDGLVDESKIKVIKNCVDDQFLLSETDINSKINTFNMAKQYNILYLSNLIPSKGFHDLLVAASLLKDRGLNYKVHFAGGFPSKKVESSFYQYIEKNNLSSLVEYHGIVGGLKKIELLKESHVFVLPTYYPQEGQPISILEAMSYGLAIITTRHGGIPDTVKDGINGYFIEKKNPEDIAEKLEFLLNHPKILLKLSLNNFSIIKKEYTERIYINNLINIITGEDYEK